MTFKNDKVFLGILISGYADRPFCYGESQMLKNIMEAQIVYRNEESGQKFVLLEELFQTEDVLSIRDGILGLLSDKENKYEFHNEYDTFSICIESQNNAFHTKITLLYSDKNVNETFIQSRDDLTQLAEYLTKCSEEFPVRL